MACEGRIIVHPPMDGAFNTAADQVQIEKAKRGRTTILRLYQWNPWTLSLGKHQSLMDVDLEACVRNHIMVVRRLTGGRAVLHAQELTYSICMPSETEKMGVHHEISTRIGQSLSYGLKALGANVQYVKKGRRVVGQRSAMCFASVARGEILWQGKKVIGSAQRVLDGVVLQHGSILLDNAHQQITDLLHNSRENAGEILISHTATLQDIMDKLPDLNDIITSIIDGFKIYFPELVTEEELSDEEQQVIAQRANAFFLGGREVGTMGSYPVSGEFAA